MCNTATKHNSRRGFTLVEAVVCIVIISIISIAALAASLATSDIVRRADDRNKAVDQAELIMACYRTNNFSEALAHCGISGYSGGNFTVYYNENFECLGIDLSDDAYYCRIEVTVGENSVGLLAIHRESGEELYKTQEWLG